MIPLFNIPNYVINTDQFTNLLHDKIVDQFTEEFCAYVGAKYGCALNSASSAIFLLAKYKRLTFDVPTMIPPVVLNAIYNGGAGYTFIDDPDWIGSSYLLYNDDFRIIDSAQEVKPIQLYGKDIAIYSFYPTKPVGGCDGGMVVSNNKEIIDWLKMLVYDGRAMGNSWEEPHKVVGWKMYMNSIQAYIAKQNLAHLDEKKDTLKRLRFVYNSAFGLANTSDHLYTIHVKNNTKFINQMKAEGMICGIHYKCTHDLPMYSCQAGIQDVPKSILAEQQIVSIPFHEALTSSEIDIVIQKVKQYVNQYQDK